MKRIEKATAIYLRTASLIRTECSPSIQERTLGVFAGKCKNPRFYTDNGRAGTTLDRPAMNELIADIRSGEIGAVAVFGLDRVARGLSPILEWFDLLECYGIRFINLKNDEYASGDPAVRIRAERGAHCA
jgi:DNA invertase Pin-like site-specific DNA recombinase